MSHLLENSEKAKKRISESAKKPLAWQRVREIQAALKKTRKLILILGNTRA